MFLSFFLECTDLNFHKQSFSLKMISSDKQYELNHKFGSYISEICDYVILIGEKQTKPIYDGLIDNNFDKKKIFVLNDVRDAFPLMNRLADKNTYVLLENDLPDLFNE